MSIPKVGDEIEVRVCGHGPDAPAEWAALVEGIEAELVCLKNGPEWCTDADKREIECQKVRLKIIAVEPGI